MQNLNLTLNLKIKSPKTLLPLTDLDVDSQNEATLQASAGESDSESEAGDAVDEVDIDDEFPESPYVYSPEPEFGGVGFYLLKDKSFSKLV